MNQITVLPDEVANHIAAGEVIERPASVVKELVENSLDAGATQIDIEIGSGGKVYIRVADDGCGMSREDAVLAFERHATSKISCTEDIFTISTLGFRGEALPSIASVSKLKLLTRPADALAGTRIDIQGGELLNVIDSGAAPGTFIEVNDLFYKTPARLKFLKSPATEVSYINNVVIDEALAHPEVGFSVKNNTRDQLHVPATQDMLQRIAGLFGRDIVHDLVEVHESAGSLELRGFIGLPSCHRANRNYQKLLVNQRAVKDKIISHAVQQAYDTLVPKRRHPVSFLCLSLPYELVDVNVHPTKTEVRFINSQAIHHFVVNAIRNTLRSTLHRGTVFSRQLPVEGDDKQLSSPQPDAPEQIELDRLPSKTTPPGMSSPEISKRSENGRHVHSEYIEREENGLDHFLPDDRIAPPSDHAPSRPVPAFSGSGMLDHLTPIRHKVFSRLKPIGQFQETYLLVQSGEDLFIIDQHAAHERIVYEQFKAQQQQEKLDIQQLLFPVSIELSHREQAILEEHLELLRQYGLEIEPFGGTTYLLKSVPVLLATSDYKKLVYDIVDQLTESGKAGIEQKLDDMLILMACHAAIRAHHPLQESQVFALLRQMDAADFPYTCPHGRPTVLKISLTDLEKKFGRTQ